MGSCLFFAIIVIGRGNIKGTECYTQKKRPVLGPCTQRSLGKKQKNGVGFTQCGEVIHISFSFVAASF